MLQVDVDKIVPVTEARDNFNKIIEEVDNTDQMYVLTKNGTPVAVVVGVNHLEKLTGDSDVPIVDSASKADEKDKDKTPDKDADAASSGTLSSSVADDTGTKTGDDDSNKADPKEEKPLPTDEVKPTTSLPEPEISEDKKPETPVIDKGDKDNIDDNLTPLATSPADDLFSDFDDDTSITPAPAGQAKSIFDNDDLPSDSTTPSTVTPASDTSAPTTPPVVLPEVNVNNETTASLVAPEERSGMKPGNYDLPETAPAPAITTPETPTAKSPMAFDQFVAPTPSTSETDNQATPTIEKTAPADIPVMPVETQTPITNTPGTSIDQPSTINDQPVSHPNYTFGPPADNAQNNTPQPPPATPQP